MGKIIIATINDNIVGAHLTEDILIFRTRKFNIFSRYNASHLTQLLHFLNLPSVTASIYTSSTQYPSSGQNIENDKFDVAHDKFIKKPFQQSIWYQLQSLFLFHHTLNTHHLTSLYPIASHILRPSIQSPFYIPALYEAPQLTNILHYSSYQR